MTAEISQNLLEALSKVDRPGAFCTSGRLPATLPGLEVEGVGAISLPLGKRQAAALRKQARQAPYGKGTRTLVDTDVRRVWEIDAERVSLTNPEWAEVEKEAVKSVQSGLGLEKQKLEAHLYKLLLYEPGSFFLPHRDGEKLDRMVATMVVCLPSVHEGGELVVRHEDRETIVDFGPEGQFHTQFAGFYADCEHEVRPVKSGNRLALVYNLTLAKSKRRILAPRSGQQIAEVAGVLDTWKKEIDTAPETKNNPSPTKLAVLLDHKYTEASLSFDALKGTDRAKADVLVSAARQSGIDASVALVTYWESGLADESYESGYGYGRYGRYGGYEKSEGPHQMEEVYESSLTAEHFQDPEGHALGFGKIPLEEKEIVSESPLNEDEPDEEDFEGYTGNEGMTLERWYHAASVVLWPAKTRFDVLCQAGVEAAVGGLEPMVHQWKQARKSEQPALKQQCVEFAEQIIAHWPSRKYANRFERDKTAKDAMPTLLEALGEASLVSRWLREVLANDVSIEPGKALGDLCQQHGWLTFRDELRELFEKTNNETIERNAKLLADWSLRKDRKADRPALCKELAGLLMAAVERWTPGTTGNWQARRVDPKDVLPPLVQSFLVLEQDELLERLVAYVQGKPKVFDLSTVQVPVLLELEGWLKRQGKRRSAALEGWLRAILEELEGRVSRPPKEPTDWRRGSATGCKCEDCQALSQFLKDPKEQTLRLPLAKEGRRHLHQVIDSRQLDTTHETERRGRPYTLVCTKTKGSYERAFQDHQRDLEQRGKMEKVLNWYAKRSKSGG